MIDFVATFKPSFFLATLVAAVIIWGLIGELNESALIGLVSGWILRSTVPVGGRRHPLPTGPQEADHA